VAATRAAGKIVKVADKDNPDQLRDWLDAAYQQIDTLRAHNSELRAENDRLRALPRLEVAAPHTQHWAKVLSLHPVLFLGTVHYRKR
jgi:hypothetical protein